MGNAHGLVAARADDHEVGGRQRPLTPRDPPLDLALRVGPGVAFDHHHVLHEHLARFPIDTQYAAGLTLVAAGNDLDGVFLLDIDPLFDIDPLCGWHQITSGASDTIFMNFLSRSSRATGRKTRLR